MMERGQVLYEVRPVLHQLHAAGVEMHYRPTRKYLHCLVIFFIFLFMLLLYIPIYYPARVREEKVHTEPDRLSITKQQMYDGNLRQRIAFLRRQSLVSDRQVSIAGWAHNRSRDLRLYVLPDNLTTLIPQPDLCTPQLFLLVVVCSAVANFEARAAIRETWASVPPAPANSSATVRVAFLLGDPDNATLQDQVEEESARHSDIIQEGFIDSYNNLTLKTVMLLKWVRSHCTSARFVMKTDDDMFVNIENLVRLLRAKGSPGLLLGALICGARPIADTTSKWYSPRYMYGGRVYPNYVSGTGYIMAGDVVQRLYQAALRTPFFHLEDVYLTGICAHEVGIRPRDYQGFTYSHRRMDPCLLRDHSVITSHRVDMAEMRKVWARMHSSALDCTAFAASQKPSSKPAGGKKVVSVRRQGNRCV